MMQEIHRRIARRQHQRLIGAGAIAAILLGTGIVWRSFAPHESIAISIPHTAHVVSQEQRTLPDGSVIDLKSGAEISVQYSDEFRRVALLKGEAHFHVAKNKSRPFIVAVENVEVRAVGTAFLVQRGNTSLEVLVTEGIVALDQRSKVSPMDGQSAQPRNSTTIHTTLGVGDRATIDLSKEIAGLRVDALDSATIAEQLAWRGPRLEFTGTPLSEAVGLINEFNSQVKIIVDDPSLAALEVSGYFRADNTDSFLRLIEQSLGVRGERKGNSIFLRKAR